MTLTDWSLCTLWHIHTMNSLTSSCWSIWWCRIWMRALTLEPEYWLVLAGQMRAKLASSSSDTMGGPGERKEEERRTSVACMARHFFTVTHQHKRRGKDTCLGRGRFLTCGVKYIIIFFFTAPAVWLGFPDVFAGLVQKFGHNLFPGGVREQGWDQTIFTLR